MKAPIKKTKAPARRRAPAKPKPRPHTVRTLAERKSKAIELCLQAISGGWTLRKFSHWSKVSKASLLRWMAEETVQPRFLAAMQVKALALPDEAMDLVHLLRRGGDYVTVPNPDKPGEFIVEFRPVDAKAIGVALRHLEFRMMREIKAQYQPGRTVTHQLGDMGQIPDDQVNARFDELMDRYQKTRQLDG